MPNELTSEQLEVWRKQREEDHKAADIAFRESQEEHVRVMYALGLLRTDITGFDIFMFCPRNSIEEVKAMSPKERAAVRLSVTQRSDYQMRFGR